MEPEEIGVYVRAGSIIARKYTRRLSALQTLQDNYMLDIYQTQDERQYAQGSLYIDDGETFNHANNKEFTLIQFTYDNGKLFIRALSSNFSEQTHSFIIDEVNIFGVRYPPRKIMIKSGELAADNSEIVYKHNIDEEHIEIGQLKIHMINHATNEEPLVRVIFTEADEEQVDVKTDL